MMQPIELSTVFVDHLTLHHWTSHNLNSHLWHIRLCIAVSLLPFFSSFSWFIMTIIEFMCCASQAAYLLVYKFNTSKPASIATGNVIFSVCVTIVGSDNRNINQFSRCWESEIPLLALYSNKYQRWIGFGLDCWLLFSASKPSIILNLNNTRKNPAQKIIYHVHVITIITTCSLPIFYKASIFFSTNSRCIFLNSVQNACEMFFSTTSCSWPAKSVMKRNQVDNNMANIALRK